MLEHSPKRFRCAGMGLDLILDLIHGALLAETIGNVPGVAKRTRKMALQNVSVQFLMFSAAHGVDEVLVVIRAALEFHDLDILFVIDDGVVVSRENDIAVFTFNNVAYARAFELIH